MTIYYGNTQLGSDYYSSTPQGRIYQGSNLVQDGIYGESNLIALYNIADPNCYPGSGDVIYDLSSNGNNLLISGSNVTYDAASGSLLISSSGTNLGQIYSPNPLINNFGNSLLGQAGEYTIITLFTTVASTTYDPHWYIGGQTQTSDGQIGDFQQGNFSQYQIAFGTDDSPTFDLLTPVYGSNPANYYQWGNDPGFVGNKRWSMQAFTKTTASVNYNARVDMQGYYPQNVATWLSSSLFSIQWASSGYPNLQHSNLATNFNSNLSLQYLYIGKNPANTSTFGSFQFGGMAIFGRALNSAQVAPYWNYFGINRTL